MALGGGLVITDPGVCGSWGWPYLVLYDVDLLKQELLWSVRCDQSRAGRCLPCNLGACKFCRGGEGPDLGQSAGIESRLGRSEHRHYQMNLLIVCISEKYVGPRQPHVLAAG